MQQLESGNAVTKMQGIGGSAVKVTGASVEGGALGRDPCGKEDYRCQLPGPRLPGL